MNKKIILLIVLFLIVFNLYNVLSINKFVLKDTNTFTYIANKEILFSGNYELKYNNEVSSLKYGNRNYYLDSIPLYYVNDTKLILPNNMLMIDTKTGNVKKINKHSQVFYEDNQYFIQDKNKKSSISDAVLYDGKSTYISLISGHIKKDDLEYIVSPFSTITVDNEIHLFNYDQKNYVTLSGIQNFDFGETNYIDLVNNIISIDGKKILLMQNFEEIENLI